MSEPVINLVTGASGGLGSALVERLRREGARVRALVRRLPAAPADGVEYVRGDLADGDAVDRAVQGSATVFHSGATMKGPWAEHQAGTIDGTRHVIDACRRHQAGKLVHVSSMSVIQWAGAEPFAPVDETTPLEPRADERGSYTRAKLEAEKLVSEAAAAGLPAVIVRPGKIFGPRNPVMSGSVARRVAGRYLVLGDGELPLPLVYVDDVVDALLLAARGDLRRGEIIQIIDPRPWTQNQVLSEVVGPDAKVLRVPRALVFALGRASEIALGALKKQSPVSRYRLQSAMALRRYESKNAEKLLGWKPAVGVGEGIRRVKNGPSGDVDQIA